MRKTKKIAAVFLSVVLALGLAAGTDATAIEAEAADISIKSVTELFAESNLYDPETDTNEVQIEVGNSFYMGDLVLAGVKYTNGQKFTHYLTGMDATYESSNNEVCTVSKTGLVTPKSVGRSKVTVKCKKKKLKVTVEVVEKGSFKSPGKTEDKNAKKIAKYVKSYKGTFNEKNAKKMISTAKKCKNILEDYYYLDYNTKRMSMETGFGADKVSGGYYQGNNKLLYPGCLHYHVMDADIAASIYIKYNPFERHTANPVTIVSAAASAGTNGVEITLNRSITDLEYTMLSYSGDIIADGKPMVMIFTVASDEPSYAILGTGSIKKGSNKVLATADYAFDKAFEYYIPEEPDASEEKLSTAKKLTTFRKGVTYTFYTGVSFDENGNLTYNAKDKSWTDNYSFAVQ